MPGNPSPSPSTALHSSQVPGKSRAVLVFSTEGLKRQLHEEPLSFELCVGLGWARRGHERPIFGLEGKMERAAELLKEYPLYGKGRLDNEEHEGETGWK